MNNLFKNLIEELKQENLLENMAIEGKKDNLNGKVSEKILPAPEKLSTEAAGSFDLPVSKTFSSEEIELTSQTAAEAPLPSSALPQTAADSLQDLSGLEEKSAPKFQSQPTSKPSAGEKEYFRKRAMEEVAGLQMVDQILSNIERGQMKMIPNSFDELPVKKALHNFLQNQTDTNSTEHAQAEFQLMLETGKWYSALSHRDRYISVAHLRQYCETTKPPLSPQALIALGRFYRNAPYSEQVRSKFDLVMTRLFSQEKTNERRVLLLTPDEIVNQIKELYADWSSIQVYTDDAEDPEILVKVQKFRDFIKEAEEATSFDELVGNNFFNRLRSFKESCQENFFSPHITGAAIEANIRIGNRYVDLIEKEKNNAALLKEKYGFLHDQVISDVTSKTLQLVELLKERQKSQKPPVEIAEIKVREKPTTLSRKKVEEKKPPLFGVNNLFVNLFVVNKWLLGLTVFTVLACLGLYFWAESKAKESDFSNQASVIKVNLDDSFLKDYLQTARINKEGFYGVTLKSWDSMTTEKKEELLGKILAIGVERGFKTVHLVNQNGKTVGFASGEKIEVYNP